MGDCRPNQREFLRHFPSLRSPRPKIPKRLTTPSVRGIISLARKSPYAPVAQLDRVSDSDSEGHAFESHRAYQKNPAAVMVCGVSFIKNHLLIFPKYRLYHRLRGSKRGSNFSADDVRPRAHVLRPFQLFRRFDGHGCARLLYLLQFRHLVQVGAVVGQVYRGPLTACGG